MHKLMDVSHATLDDGTSTAVDTTSRATRANSIEHLILFHEFHGKLEYWDEWIYIPARLFDRGFGDIRSTLAPPHCYSYELQAD